MLLPAWSFLWGISTWDYYWYTGDKGSSARSGPHVIRNLKGAEQMRRRRRACLPGPYWNMFDWTPIDQQHKAVLHNTMFMIGAIDAALKEAEVLGDSAHAGLAARAAGAAGGGRESAVGRRTRSSYPDSVHEDGTAEPLDQPAHQLPGDSVRRGRAGPPRRRPGGTCWTRRRKWCGIGSPFAVLYLYEALEKLGLEERIVADIYHNYLPMLESGATTVWESFPTGTTGRGGFPTRSHCHAWSSAPSYFLNRIVLGIKPTRPRAGAGCKSARGCAA